MRSRLGFVGVGVVAVVVTACFSFGNNAAPPPMRDCPKQPLRGDDSAGNYADNLSCSYLETFDCGDTRISAETVCIYEASPVKNWTCNSMLSDGGTWSSCIGFFCPGSYPCCTWGDKKRVDCNTCECGHVLGGGSIWNCTKLDCKAPDASADAAGDGSNDASDASDAGADASDGD